MESTITYTAENCFICSEFMGEFRNELSVVTGYSERPIVQLIEEFTGTIFNDEVMQDAGICQNCFIKFNEYDEHQVIADTMKSHLMVLFEASTQAKQDEQNVQVKSEEDFGVYDVIADDQQPQKFDEMFLVEEVITETNEVEWEEEQEAVTPKKDNYKSVVKYDRRKSHNTSNENSQNTCEICSRTFKEKSKLKAHREIHTNERNIICPDCGKAFKTAACLRSHKRIHNPTYMYCDMCGKSYTQKTELSKHIKFVHYKIREHNCEMCHASFGSKGHLATHRLTHLGQAMKNVICPVCAIGFHTRAKLDRHMKSHTGERNYWCELCGKKFLYSYNVTAHIRHVHNREKRKDTDRECPICSKKFTKLWKLKDHLADEHNITEELNIASGMSVEGEDVLYEEITGS